MSSKHHFIDIFSLSIILNILFFHVTSAGSSPKIFDFRREYSVNVNTKFKLLCYVQDGDRPISYQWSFNSRDISENSQNIVDKLKITIKNDGEESTLIIDKVRGEHSGNLTCRASNHAGSDVQSTILNVKGLVVYSMNSSVHLL